MARVTYTSVAKRAAVSTMASMYERSVRKSIEPLSGH